MGLHHDHAHGPHPAGGEPALTSATTQRLMLGAVLALVLVAVVGLLLLWPRADRLPLGAEFGFDAEVADATVVRIDVEPCLGTDPEARILCQEVHLEGTSGVAEGATGSFQLSIDASSVEIRTGDRIVVEYRPDAPDGFQFRFLDFQRRTPLVVLAVLFGLAVLALGRWQGLRALAGLAITGLVVVGFLFPALLEGRNPTAVALVTAVLIALTALYLTHGVNERTTVALLGALAALGLTAVLAWAFSAAARITGFASEDAILLQVAAAEIDIRGLVLAGIIIGSLGVLDDVTITQSSAVWQLHRANPGYGLRQLYESAVTIGRDHIASAVNTLVLAYAGAALPLLLFFTQAGRPLAEVAAGEVVAVEIIRTLVGSIGLIASVPLTTFLAAVVITRGTPSGVAAPDAGEGPLAPRGAAEPDDRSATPAEAGERPAAEHASIPGEPSEAADEPDGADWDAFGPGEDPERW